MTRKPRNQVEHALDRLLLATWSDCTPVVLLMAPSQAYAKAWIEGFRFGQSYRACDKIVGSAIDLSSATVATLREVLERPERNAVPDIARITAILDSEAA